MGPFSSVWRMNGFSQQFSGDMFNSTDPMHVLMSHDILERWLLGLPFQVTSQVWSFHFHSGARLSKHTGGIRYLRTGLLRYNVVTYQFVINIQFKASLIHECQIPRQCPHLNHCIIIKLYQPALYLRLFTILGISLVTKERSSDYQVAFAVGTIRRFSKDSHQDSKDGTVRFLSLRREVILGLRLWDVAQETVPLLDTNTAFSGLQY